MIWSRIQAHKLEQRIQRNALLNAPQIATTDNTLEPLAQLAQTITNIPRKPIPTPHRAHSYALVEQPEHMQTGLRLIHISSYVGSATLVLGLALTSVFAANAHPGSPLYAYKLKGEQIRLHFTTSPESKLNLQLSLVENRIKDTETALNDATIDTATKVATLQELTAQTKAAVEAATEVAVAQKNPTVLDKIELLTQSQVKVLSQNPDASNQKLGSHALAAAQENSKTIAEAKLLVAASQESDVTNLPAETHTIKGLLTVVSASHITIDEISLTTTDQTEIKSNKPENKDTKPELKVGQTVSVTAVKNGKTLTAQTILIISASGKVKSSADSKNDATDPIDAIIDIKSELPTTPELPTETEKIQSGFQVENPSPLYPSNP